MTDFSGTLQGTDLIRQQYISQTINDQTSIPSDTRNNWSIAASNSSLAGDQNPGVGKVAVVIYRVAYKIGETDGVILGVNDPKPWDPAYRTQNIQPLHTKSYPVLRDVTEFRWKAVREGGSIVFDLLTESLTPWTPPALSTSYPLVAAAVWSNRGVTGYLQDQIQSSRTNPVAVQVGTAGMGGYIDVRDPWPGVKKQVTCLIGYCFGNDTTHVVWRTIVDMGAENPWVLSIPKTPQPPKYPQQLPIPNEYPGIDLIWFRNETPLDVWPNLVVDNGVVFWDGKKNDNPDQYRIKPSKS